MARNKTREKKIIKMILFGLSDSQIAGTFHVKKSVVAELRANCGNAGNPIAGKSIAGKSIAGTILRESEKNVQSKKTVKPKKEAGKSGGIGDPGNSEPQDRGGKPAGPDPEFHPTGETGGEPEGSTGNPKSTGIKFIGGKKNMAKKKEGDPDPEEKEYECPHCHHEFNERSDTCPSCGETLSGYED